MAFYHRFGLRTRLSRLLGFSYHRDRARAHVEGHYTATYFASRLDLRDVATAGAYTSGKPRVMTHGDQKLTIGKYCSIGEGVTIFLGRNHRTDFVTTFQFTNSGAVWLDDDAVRVDDGATKGDVTIGNDVYIGEHACILSGVTIGDGAVIGTRAVVTKDVPPYGIAVGNPARVAKYRFDPPTIEALRQIAWWDWPDDQVRAEVPSLLSADVRAFVRKWRPDPTSVVPINRIAH